MIYLLQGEKCENTYHVQGFGAWDTPGMTTVANVFPQWEHDFCIPWRTNQCSLLQVHARDLTTEAGIELDAVWAVGTIGTNVGAPLPNSVTLAIKAATGIAGRSHRGRTYWIGLTETMVTANGINTTPGNGIVTAMNELNDLVPATGFGDLVVLSRKSNAYPPPHDRPAGITTSIANYQLTDPYVDVQRRRLPAHNRHR